jgi:hypothetical protein
MLALSSSQIAEPSAMRSSIGEDDPVFGQQSADDLGKARGMNRSRQRRNSLALIVPAINDAGARWPTLDLSAFSYRADRKLGISD